MVQGLESFFLHLKMCQIYSQEHLKWKDFLGGMFQTPLDAVKSHLYKLNSWLCHWREDLVHSVQTSM